jgi:AcrR family transcriptional regulator
LSSSPDRPLRADAARNRARVLQVADEVFGEQGPAGSTEEVARRAGVGIATVFRHFSTKQELLAAVLANRLDAITQYAEQLSHDGDPATAFFDFFRHVVAHADSKRLLTEAIVDAGIDIDDARRGADVRLHDAVGRLLRAAQAAGVVRADVGTEEVLPLMAAAARLAEVSQEDARRDRAIGILLDGLRPR